MSRTFSSEPYILKPDLKSCYDDKINVRMLLEAAGKLTGLGYSEMEHRYAEAKAKAGLDETKILVIFLADLYNLIKEE